MGLIRAKTPRAPGDGRGTVWRYRWPGRRVCAL